MAAVLYAAGAMRYLVVELLSQPVPDQKSSLHGTLGAMAGFAIMIVLDIALE